MKVADVREDAGLNDLVFYVDPLDTKYASTDTDFSIGQRLNLSSSSFEVSDKPRLGSCLFTDNNLDKEIADQMDQIAHYFEVAENALDSADEFFDNVAELEKLLKSKFAKYPQVSFRVVPADSNWSEYHNVCRITLFKLLQTHGDSFKKLMLMFLLMINGYGV